MGNMLLKNRIIPQHKSTVPQLYAIIKHRLNRLEGYFKGFEKFGIIFSYGKTDYIN